MLAQRAPLSLLCRPPAVDVYDGNHEARRPRSDRDTRVDRIDRLGVSRRRARSARTTCSSSSSTTRAARARTCRSVRTPPTSTRFRRATSRRIPATANSRSASRPASAGTRWPWCSTPTRCRANTAATCPPTHPRPRCTKWASTISGARRRTSIPATWCSCRATPRPASTRAPSSKAASSEDQLKHFRQEASRRRAVVLSASLAHA